MKILNGIRVMEQTRKVNGRTDGSIKNIFHVKDYFSNEPDTAAGTVCFRFGQIG